MKKKTKKTAKKTGTGAKSSRKKGLTIVDYVRSLFKADLEISTETLLKKVGSKFPDSAFSKAHVSFYRNKFRKEGMDIPLLRSSKKAKKTKKSSSKVGSSKKRKRPSK